MSPVPHPPPPPTQPSPISSAKSYQEWTTSNKAIYTLKPSYKTFSDSFILSKTDSNLPTLSHYLSANYGTYVNQGNLTSGFKRYNDYDNAIDYQLIYDTIFGPFNAYITYDPSTSTLTLKSLSVVNFNIMQIDTSNCKKKGENHLWCETCQDNFRNFMGRCRPYDPYCLQYLTDECGACLYTHKLVKGQCQMINW